MFLLKRTDPTLTATQKALLRSQQIDARGAFAIVNTLLVVLVLYTTYRFPHKFVRVTGECDSNWLQLGVAESADHVVCCDASFPPELQQAPCHAGMSLAPVLVSLQAAWVLPLTPLVFNYVILMLGEKPTMPRIRVLVRRAGLYLALMLFRTLVLYMSFNQIENAIVTLLFGGSADRMCWYSGRRRNNKCASHFDHSDHLVLLVSHYLAIPLFEWFALSVEIAVAWKFSVKKTVLRFWTLLLGGAVVYTLFFTASYFHSAWENILALLVAQLFVMLPLYLLSQDYFASSKMLRLRNFVLPAAEDFKNE